MNPLGHMAQKLIAERARRQLEPSPSTAPPPYYSSFDDEGDSSSSDDDEESVEALPPVRLLVNAAHTVRGSNNILPIPNSVLGDVTKLSQNLAATMTNINNAMSEASDERPQRRRKVIQLNITVNCGITVFGDRNVIGNVALRARPNPDFMPPEEGQSATTPGAKRPAEEDNEEAPPAKRLASEGMASDE